MRYAKIRLSGLFRDTGEQAKSFPAATGRRFRYDEFLIRVEKILGNRKISRVLIEYAEDFRPLLFAGLEEIREQLLRLEEGGKEVVFFAKQYDGRSLYLASACGRRVLHPLGNLSYLGFSRSFVYFKQAMDTQGITAEVIRRGRYKSAGDRFRVDRMDPFDEEQYRRYFEELAAEASEKIGEGFGKGEEEIERLLQGNILDAETARKESWADELATIHGIEQRWRQEEKLKRKKYRRLGRSIGSGRKRIAVLFFEGAVVDGKTRRHPLLGQAVGADSFVPHIEKLAKEKSIKGVVLRINSGGGSAYASEDVLDALRRLAEKKPLVVSMSELAGSGGYWIACAGERLFVRRTTLTGSIGVLMMLAGAKRLLEDHGITASTLRTAPYADLGSALREATEQERGMIDAQVEKTYAQFLDRAASFRGMERGELEKRAAGRVWAGSDAVAQGLADEIGGLQEAVEYMKGRLGFDKAKLRFYPEIKRSFLERRLERAARKSAPVARSGPLASLSGAAASQSAGRGLHALSALVRETSMLNGRPLALLPEYLSIAAEER